MVAARSRSRQSFPFLTIRCSCSRSLSLNSIGLTRIPSLPPAHLKCRYFTAWRFVVKRLPAHLQKALFARINRYQLKLKNAKADLGSGAKKANEQFKANSYSKAGQYKRYLVIPVKTTRIKTYVVLGYQPIGKQNALWLRFNPSHLSKFGYKLLKKKLVKILGAWVLQYFPLAVPTRLDVAVDLLGVTPSSLLADLHETRNSSLHCSAGNVETITMGTNRSTTQACIYQKNFVDTRNTSALTGTRVEIRLRRLNLKKGMTLETLADSLPNNPFKRLHLYQPDEHVDASMKVKLSLVLAAARAIGLKAALMNVPEAERKTLRRKLKAMLVTYVDSDSDHIWEQVPRLLAPLAILYDDPDQ